MSVRSFLAVLALAVLAAPACSGGGSNELTKAQVAGHANAICAQANQAIAGMYRPDPLDGVATAAALEKVLERQRRELRQLRALVPPEADANDYGRWLTQIDLALDRGDTSRRAIAKGDVQAAGEANRRADQIRADADRFANAYGMRDCGQG